MAELLRNPIMIDEVIHNEDRVLDRSQSEEKSPESPTNDSYNLQKTHAEMQEQSLKLCQV